MTLRGILFDMGDTLLRFRPDGLSWEAFEKHAAQALHAYLSARAYSLPAEAKAIDIYWDYFDQFWRNPTQHPAAELKIDYQVQQIARLWGIDALPAADQEGMHNAYLEVMRSHVRPMAGAAETLRALRERGLRVGLISNTIWRDADHMADLDQHGLSPYIEHYIFSGDAEIWKPDHAIFERGLAALDLAPGEAAYVGDSLYFDVWGAQQAGMRGVWIESPTFLPDGLTVTPDATITALPDLLAVIDQWHGDA